MRRFGYVNENQTIYSVIWQLCLYASKENEDAMDYTGLVIE